nr:CYP370C13 protein [Diaphanosoma celebensis]
MLVPVILTIFLLWLAYRVTSRPAHFPPGPLNLPLLGYAPFLKLSSPLHLQLADLSRKYGNVSSINFGSHRVVILSSLDAIRKAYRDESLSGRSISPILSVRSEDKKGILFSDGHNWQEMRWFTLRNLRDFGFGKSSLQGLVQSEIAELLSHLEENAGRPIQLSNRFNVAVVNALWSITTGQRFSQDDPEVKKRVEQLTRTISSIGLVGTLTTFFPFLSKIGPVKKQVNDALDNIHLMKKMVLNVMESHKSSHSAGDESDFIHSFLERMNGERDPQSPFYGHVGNTNLKISLLDLFVAGAETTSTTLLWSVLLLATHPDAQKKCQEEIDRVVPRDELPSLEHRAEMPYLEAVLMEIQRYASLVPIVTHLALQDAELCGYSIPKGTVIMANSYQVHHDPQYWERPDEFHPPHFLNADGSVKLSEAFIPFSTGKRLCLGESLAKMELFLFLAAFLQRFNFEFPADQPKPSLEPVTGPILTPRPYQVVVTTRIPMRN